MKKEAAQALLDDKSENGAEALLRGYVLPDYESWTFVIASHSESKFDEGSDCWLPLAIHKTEGLELGDQGLVSSCKARILSDSIAGEPEVFQRKHDGITYWFFSTH